MLELALNKSKEKGSGYPTTTASLIASQQAVTTNFEDLQRIHSQSTMAPPPSQPTVLSTTTYSNALPTTFTSDITSIIRKGNMSVEGEDKWLTYILRVYPPQVFSNLVFYPT